MSTDPNLAPTFGVLHNMQKISHREDSQLESIQLTLPISRRAQQVIVPTSVIAAQPTKLSAIKLCMQASGLQDKEICDALGIDCGHFSRVLKGDAYFPNNKEHALMDLCGNEIPLQWDALRRGKELKPLLSTLEQENDELRRQLAEKSRENELMVRLWKETRAA